MRFPRVLSPLFWIFLFVSSAFVAAQTASVQPLVTQPVDESQLTMLRGNTHPLARPQYDQGPAPLSMAMNRMLLVLKRSPAQESALRRMLDDQQDKASPNYHKWFTPDEFGQQFGLADADVQAVTVWLQTHGFQVGRVSRGRTIIEFSGTAADVQQAFHTSIHSYLVNGEQHWANDSDPQIPAALAPVVGGADSLHNFPRKSMSHFLGSYSKVTRKLIRANPQFTIQNLGCSSDNNCYALVPYDFASIYNVLPLWNAGIDGTGQKIAIVGRSNINIQDVRDFRSLFGLPANDPNIILNGPDPGLGFDEPEANIDVQWSGAVAKNATIDFVVSESTETTDGVDLSAEYIIDNNLAPVMSESYGFCELGFGTAGNQFFNTLWEQAAAQGITVFVSSGDNGSAGCDFNQGLAPQPAQFGLAVNGIASTPFNVAVGGTDFNDYANPLTYWNAANDPVTQASAKGYIPETTWNDTCTNSVYLASFGFGSNQETNCNDPQLLGGVVTVGGSGGSSNCTVNSQQPGTCSGGYTKPSWQTGSGVPADGKRDLPDVSLFSGNGLLGSFYVICESDLTSGFCNLNSFAGFGGTSVASPAMAGIMALVNQQNGSPQGNANYVFYKLAAQQPTSFHDVTSGTIAMPCARGTLNCTTTTAGHQYGVLSGYSTTSGYDLATGLGSVNAMNLVNNWHTVTFTATTSTLTLSPVTGIMHGQSVNLTVHVAPSSGSGTPTGDVSLLTSTGQSVGRFTLSGGNISTSTSLLPGGTYTVTSHYAGDSTFGGSDSTPPISITVGKENSKTSLNLITFSPVTGQIVNPNATTAVYGSPYLLRVNVTNLAGAGCGPLGGCATGTIALTDNGSALDGGAFGLNSLGYTEDQLIQLAGGNNTVQAQYPGDNSFNASSASATYSITPASTTVSSPQILVPQAGTPGPILATVNTQSSGVAPSGTVSFFANGAQLSGPVTYTPTAGSFNGPASLQASLFATIATPGTYSVTATYNGDTNYAAANSTATNVTLKYPVPTATLNPSASTLTAGASLTLTALVISTLQGAPAPGGTVSFSGVNTGPVSGTVTYTTVQAGNGTMALQASITFAPAFTEFYLANYSGDANYPANSAFSGTVTVNGTDFSLIPPQGPLTVTAGRSISANLSVGLQTGAAPVNFAANACSGLPAQSTCSISQPTVTSTQTVVITLTTTAPHAVMGQVLQPQEFGWWTTTLGTAFAAVFLIGSTKRRRASWWSLITLAFLLLGMGCGGGGSSGGGGGFKDPGTPKGNYTITITGTSGSITHTTMFTLTVQ